jgi:glyoxylase-like metal-dependent hydrolase (beta-lactamase superfamily II)
MKEVAAGVWQLKGALPFPNAINTYLVGDVLIDAGAKFDGRKILRQLDGREVAAHALTHAHFDHQGSSKLVCETLGIPFWVSEVDAPAAEDPRLIRERQPDKLINKINYRLYGGPGHKVDRLLREGDEVAGFEVLETPGHSAGHIAFWRKSDRVLILGDVLTNMNTTTGLRGLHEPKRYYTPDPVTNRRSAKRLGPLEPSLVLFGHGAPLCDTRKFVDFCAGLAD